MRKLFLIICLVLSTKVLLAQKEDVFYKSVMLLKGPNSLVKMSKNSLSYDNGELVITPWGYDEATPKEREKFPQIVINKEDILQVEKNNWLVYPTAIKLEVSDGNTYFINFPYWNRKKLIAGLIESGVAIEN